MVAPTPLVGVDVGWAGDRLLYALLSPADNRPAVWALGRGESNPVELIGNASSPGATANGQTIVFSRVENGRRGIWRANGEGRNAVEIGSAAAGRVSLTPDGKQVIYLTSESGTQSAWIMPLDGGKPTQVANVFAYHPAVSPDGTWIAFVSVGDQRQAVISVCALSDCSSRRNLPVTRCPTRGVAYSVLSNIWCKRSTVGAPAN